MSPTANRIDVYLSDDNYELVTATAVHAGMKTPTYLRRIACEVRPEPKTRDFVTHGVALVARELATAAKAAKEITSKDALLAARDRLRSLLKQHLGAAVEE